MKQIPEIFKKIRFAGFFAIIAFSLMTWIGAYGCTAVPAAAVQRMINRVAPTGTVTVIMLKKAAASVWIAMTVI